MMVRKYYKKLFIFLFIFVILCLSIIYWNAKNVKSILIWVPFFDNYSWYMKNSSMTGEELFASINCPVTNCFITHQENYLEDITKFDAIIFHTPDYIKRFPNDRAKRQLYVMASKESYFGSSTKFDHFQHFFNLTMTYRIDSDINWNYFRINDKESHESIAPSASPKWRKFEKDFYDDELLNLTKNKSSPIAWFVSNCHSSDRLRLANEISKIVPVDIYGACGNFSCPRSDSQACDELLERKYFFYLAFENSLHEDYVTEKLSRALSKFVVPIVFNGADSSRFAPPHSYINAQDFNNVTQLGDYLKFLIENPQDYIKYFWWKTYYEMENEATFEHSMCDLCQKLNNQTFMSKVHKMNEIDLALKNRERYSKIKF